MIVVVEDALGGEGRVVAHLVPGAVEREKATALWPYHHCVIASCTPENSE
jgi:hypothetical protein